MKKWNLEINQRLDTEDIDQLVGVILGLTRNHFSYLEHGDYVFESNARDTFDITLHAIEFLANNYWEVSFSGDTCEIKR